MSANEPAVVVEEGAIVAPAGTVDWVRWKSLPAFSKKSLIKDWEDLSKESKQELEDKANAFLDEAVRKNHKRPLLSIPQLIGLLLRNPRTAATELGKQLAVDPRFKDTLTPNLIAMYDPLTERFATKQQQSVSENFKAKYDAIMKDVSVTCKELFEGLTAVEQNMLSAEVSRFPQPDYDNITQTHPRVFENVKKLEAYLALFAPYIVMPTWKQEEVDSKKKEDSKTTVVVSFTNDEYGDVLRRMGVLDVGYYTGDANWLSLPAYLPVTYYNKKFAEYPSVQGDSNLQEFLDYWCGIFNFFLEKEQEGKQAEVVQEAGAEEESGEEEASEEEEAGAKEVKGAAPPPVQVAPAGQAGSMEVEGEAAQPKKAKGPPLKKFRKMIESESESESEPDVKAAQGYSGLGGGAPAKSKRARPKPSAPAKTGFNFTFPQYGAAATDRRKIAKALVLVYSAFVDSSVFITLLKRRTVYKEKLQEGGEKEKVEPLIGEYALLYPLACKWYLDVLAKRLKLRFMTDTQVSAMNFIVAHPASLALRLQPTCDDAMKKVVGDRFAANAQPELLQSVYEAVEMTDCSGNSVISTSRHELERLISEIVTDVALSPDTFSNSHLNVVLMGAAGAGKTRFAMILGNIMKKCGLLLSERAIDVVSKPDLVGQYMGQSAPRTKARLFQNLENVLFIDEAYALADYTVTPNDEIVWDPYGVEVMTEMVNFLDKYKGRICVIAAGYEDPMKNRFLAINEGLPRRFPFKLKLPNYSPTELTALFCYFLRKNAKLEGVLLEPDAITELANVIEGTEKELFPNSAGDVENFASIAGRILVRKKTLDQNAKLTISDIYSALLEYCQTVQQKGCLFLLNVPVPTLTQKLMSFLPFSIGIRAGYARQAEHLGFIALH